VTEPSASTEGEVTVVEVAAPTASGELVTVVDVFPVTGSGAVVTVVDCAATDGSAGTVVVVVLVAWAISAAGVNATAAAIIRVRIVSPFFDY
jgi:uracil phosphoribosyltransferase